jgi:hypothetical protein
MNLLAHDMLTTFLLVYKGGHHEVFCNKKKHFTLTGSAYGTSPLSEHKNEFTVRLNKCDCDKYK